MRIRRFVGVSALILVVLAVGAASYGYVARRLHGDALWRIVSQQCVPNYQENRQATPCLRVDLGKGYVLYKDQRGALHDLLMPTEAIPGVESGLLDQAQTADFMALAWENRQHLSEMAGQKIPDAYIVLAVNSYLGRSQDQLHIHIACVRQDVYQTLTRVIPGIGSSWAALPEPLGRQSYWARRVTPEDLASGTPFQWLNQHLRDAGKQPGEYGLAMMALPDTGFLLLATGLNWRALDLGSTERLQDFSCQIADVRP